MVFWSSVFELLRARRGGGQPRGSSESDRESDPRAWVLRSPGERVAPGAQSCARAARAARRESCVSISAARWTTPPAISTRLPIPPARRRVSARVLLDHAPRRVAAARGAARGAGLVRHREARFHAGAARARSDRVRRLRAVRLGRDARAAPSSRSSSAPRRCSARSSSATRAAACGASSREQLDRVTGGALGRRELADATRTTTSRRSCASTATRSSAASSCACASRIAQRATTTNAGVSRRDRAAVEVAVDRDVAEAGAREQVLELEAPEPAHLEGRVLVPDHPAAARALVAEAHGHGSAPARSR